jgi:hypothetical protein
MAPRKGEGARNRGRISKRGGTGGHRSERNSTPASGITSVRGGSTVAGGNGGGGGGTRGEHGGNGCISEVAKSGDGVRQDSPIAVLPSSFMSMLDLVPLEYRGYDNEMEFRSIAQKWQEQLQTKDFSAHPLGDGELPIVREVAALVRVKAALAEMPNPFAEAIRTEALHSSAKVVERSEPYISKLVDGDWVGAVLQIFQDIRTNDETDWQLAERQKRLYDHWIGSFVGNSLQGLQTTIQHYQSNWNIAYAERYSKSINIVQSSGMGKSRLADEMGKTNFQFSFVFRNLGDTGYPPGDSEITHYFRQSSHDPSILVAGFYAAIASIGKSGVHVDFGVSLLTFDSGLEWYDKLSKQSPREPTAVLANLWHDLLAPTREREGNPVGVPSCDRQGLVRSNFRRKVYFEIVNRARGICEDLRTIHGKVINRILSSVEPL